MCSPMCFVGYGLHQKGYRCFHPPTHKLYVTIDVQFHKHQMYFPATATTNQGEESLNLESFGHQIENISHTLIEPEPSKQEPAEPEHIDAATEPTTLELQPPTVLELQPCDHPNIAKPNVS